MRPLGNRIKQVLEALDKTPWLNYAQIAEQVGIENTNAHKYCNRAIAMGLIEANYNQRPAKYRAAPNWRAKVEKVNEARKCFLPKPTERHAAPKRIKPRINSVWALADACGGAP